MFILSVISYLKIDGAECVSLVSISYQHHGRINILLYTVMASSIKVKSCKQQ